jgi:hypothetical protein
MNTNIAKRILQLVGGLLIALGLVHIAATPHIPELLRGTPSVVYERALGPTLLNHILVGILLIPLGFTTSVAASASTPREPWVRRILWLNTVVVFCLPLSVAVFMRRAEFYTSPLFLSAVLLTLIISCLTGVAAFSLTRQQRLSDNERYPE